jgi:DNA-binding MarR family transcriptional regulator
MNCLCANTRHAARLLTRLYDEHLRASGLTVAQFELLSVLAEFPELAQHELAAQLDLDQTTLSRNLRLLQARGWIMRGVAEDDLRQRWYLLTEAGEAQWKAALLGWQRAQKKMQKGLGVEFEQTLAILGRVQTLAAK